MKTWQFSTWGENVALVELCEQVASQINDSTSYDKSDNEDKYAVQYIYLQYFRLAMNVCNINIKGTLMLENKCNDKVIVRIRNGVSKRLMRTKEVVLQYNDKSKRVIIRDNLSINSNYINIFEGISELLPEPAVIPLISKNITEMTKPAECMYIRHWDKNRKMVNILSQVANFIIDNLNGNYDAYLCSAITQYLYLSYFIKNKTKLSKVHGVLQYICKTNKNVNPTILYTMLARAPMMITANGLSEIKLDYGLTIELSLVNKYTRSMLICDVYKGLKSILNNDITAEIPYRYKNTRNKHKYVDLAKKHCTQESIDLIESYLRKSIIHPHNIKTEDATERYEYSYSYFKYILLIYFENRSILDNNINSIHFIISRFELYHGSYSASINKTSQKLLSFSDNFIGEPEDVIYNILREWDDSATNLNRKDLHGYILRIVDYIITASKENITTCIIPQIFIDIVYGHVITILFKDRLNHTEFLQLLELLKAPSISRKINTGNSYPRYQDLVDIESLHKLTGVNSFSNTNVSMIYTIREYLCKLDIQSAFDKITNLINTEVLYEVSR